MSVRFPRADEDDDQLAHLVGDGEGAVAGEGLDGVAVDDRVLDGFDRVLHCGRGGLVTATEPAVPDARSDTAARAVNVGVGLLALTADRGSQGSR